MLDGIAFPQFLNRDLAVRCGDRGTGHKALVDEHQIHARGGVVAVHGGIAGLQEAAALQSLG